MADPLALLNEDRDEAQRLADPWASLCVLATVTPEGSPQARVLVLRDLDPGLGIFINASSPKHHQIEAGRTAGILIYLASVGVQYRLEAGLAAIDPETIRSGWNLRPEIPKVMDWLYETRVSQSTALDSRDALLTLYEDVRGNLPDDLVAPAGATGYRIEPSRIERLKLSGDRVHERDLYEASNEGWTHRVLVP
jgi:pyridoxamine 5'-phosphate oxidase